MRSKNNRQTVSSTARWNLVQGAPGISSGARKVPITNRQTGGGSNLDSLKRSLGKAELHLQSITSPYIAQNLRHGIDLLKAQIARLSGNDISGFDLNSVQDSNTGYEFAGTPDGTDLESVATSSTAYEQSRISSFAGYQLWGTLRQKITKVAPSVSHTPAGSLEWIPPESRSNVIRTPNNPQGDVFPVGIPGNYSGMLVTEDTRDSDYVGQSYQQGFTNGTHHEAMDIGNGIFTSEIIPRGKSGQILKRKAIDTSGG